MLSCSLIHFASQQCLVVLHCNEVAMVASLAGGTQQQEEMNTLQLFLATVAAPTARCQWAGGTHPSRQARAIWRPPKSRLAMPMGRAPWGPRQGTTLTARARAARTGRARGAQGMHPQPPRSSSEATHRTMLNRRRTDLLASVVAMSHPHHLLLHRLIFSAQ